MNLRNFLLYLLPYFGLSVSADISISGGSVITITSDMPDSVFEYMDQATFETFDTFVNLTSSISSELEIDNAISKLPLNTHTLTWEDSSGERLTPLYVSHVVGNSSTTSVLLEYASGEIYNSA